jgi:hypothetical protein
MFAEQYANSVSLKHGNRPHDSGGDSVLYSESGQPPD